MSDLSTTAIDSVSAGVGVEQIDQFKWLVVTGGFVCFAMAWGIGANDVANAFSTSVGAKAINLKQATVIAGIFEFAGAIGLGGTVTSTVRKGIVDWDLFVGEEDILMLGMFSSLLAAAIWLALATRYELPVSTTQSVVGAIAGFAICAKGSDAIHWVGQYDEHGNLEKYNGVLFIALFWVGSPFFAAMCSVVFFMPIRNFLLRRQDSYEATLKVWPLFVFIVVFIMVLFLLIKGLKRLDFEYEENLGLSFGVTIGVALLLSMICWMTLIRTGLVHRTVTDYLAKYDAKSEKESPVKPNTPSADKMEKGQEQNGLADIDMEPVDDPKVAELEEDIVGGDEQQSKQFLDRVKDQALRGITENIHDNLGELEKAIQENAEQFDPRTERAFSWLQVCSAALDAFAHGSNDVANAVAPFAAMVALYEVGEAQKEVPVYEWILVIGAVGIVLGLSTYGYKIMKCLGVRMAPMTCTRGYSVELSSALIVIMASHYGFPTSTTHAQVGATVGIGLVELCNSQSQLRIGQVVNWKLLIQVLFGWVLTLFIAGLTSALIFSVLAYSPYAGETVERS